MAGHVLSCHGAPCLLYTFTFDMMLTNQSVFALTQEATDSLTPPVVLFRTMPCNELDIYDGKLNNILSAHWCLVEHWPTFACVLPLFGLGMSPFPVNNQSCQVDQETDEILICPFEFKFSEMNTRTVSSGGLRFILLDTFQRCLLTSWWETCCCESKRTAPGKASKALHVSET